MDLYQLRYFLEAARELNFTRAAANLHVSPSAVSRSVALLERSLGRRLFARSRRRVALSAAGEALLARAQRVFDEVERARAELSEAQAPSELRVGSREMITNYLLPGPLARFEQRWPGTRFGLFELDPQAMAAALKKDQLDLGFYYADLADPALEARFLGRLRSHIYAAKGFAKGAPPFIAPRSFGADPAAPRADGYPDHRRARDIRYEADFLETHRRFVLTGLCAGVLPDLVLRDELKAGRVVVLDGPPLHRDVWCFRRKGRALPPAAESLVAWTRSAVRAAS